MAHGHFMVDSKSEIFYRLKFREKSLLGMAIRRTFQNQPHLPTTEAPLAANSSAYSRPRPPPAPVTTATRPAKLSRLDTILLAGIHLSTTRVKSWFLNFEK